MANILDNLNILDQNIDTAKTTLANNLTAKGVPSTTEDTLTAMASKVAEISGGGDDEPFKFSEIGYTGNEEPIKAGLAYAKQINDNWDATQTNLNYKFENDSNLIFMPLVDTSQATNMSSFYANCQNLITVPVLDTSNCLNMSGFYNSCPNIKQLPVLDTSKCENMDSMYSNMGGIETIPEMDTSKCKNFNYFCSNNYELTTVPVLDLSSAKYISYMFISCVQLNLIKFKGNPANITSLSGAFGNDWSGLKENGTLYYDLAYDYSAIIAELKRSNPTWVVKPAFTPETCTSLQITADDVIGDDTTTLIHYTATCNGVNDYTGESIEGVELKGDVRSEKFEQNNTGAPRQVTISYNYLGQTATTEITQSTGLNPDVLEFEFTGDAYTYNIDNNTYTATTSPVLIKPSVQYPNMYQISFSNSDTANNLTKFNRFRGYDNQLSSFSNMFEGNKNLTSVRIKLKNTISTTDNMFQGCSSLKEIILEGEPTGITSYEGMFGYDDNTNLAENGTLIYDLNSAPFYTSIINELKEHNPTWTAKSSLVMETCSQLSITADDVEGDVTTTTIHYTATVSGYNSIGGYIIENREITGDIQSEDFGVNPSITESRQITISYSLLDKNATTTITQAASPIVAYDVTFNSQDDVNKWTNEGTWTATNGKTYPVANANFYHSSETEPSYVSYEINWGFSEEMRDKPGYFVSEKINLAPDTNYTLKVTNGNGGGDSAAEYAISVREVGGQWTDIYQIQADGIFNLTEKNIDITQYAGKQIEIAFKIMYKSDYWSTTLALNIRSVKIEGVAV